MAPALTPAEQSSRQAALLEFSSMSAPSHCPLGLYMLPSPSNPLVWECVLFIHRGYYANSILRFSLSLPTGYPHNGVVPSVTFSGALPFHPLVDARTGVMNLGGRWLSWREGDDWVWMILHWVKASFKRRALDEVREADALNREAWKAYRTQTAQFAKLTANAANQSIADTNLFPTEGKAKGGIAFRKLEKDTEAEEVAHIQTSFDEQIKARLVKRPAAAAQ